MGEMGSMGGVEDGVMKIEDWEERSGGGKDVG